MKVSIVGFGLIGASIAASLKEKVKNLEIVAIDPNPQSLSFGLSVGYCDVPRETIDTDVRGSDYVVIAVHLGVIKAVAEDLVRVLSGDELVMDVSSVKGWVVEEVGPIFRDRVSFVPCHPIAGTEKSGARNAVKGLFESARCIITPWNNVEEEIERAKSFWEILGSKVEYMDPYEHDKIFSKVSHLPHLVAYSLVDYLLDGSEYAVRYAGGGFKDFTRIAASSAEMWVEIFRRNRRNLLEDLEGLLSTLRIYKSIIEAEDYEALRARIDLASNFRREL